LFLITFENEIHKQWSCEYVFENFDDAKHYLISQGFIETGRIFERKNYNWSKYIKAYITPKKIYSKDGAK